jgi:hypothetical protein
MPSAVKANLLDDGVVDTFVSVGPSDVQLPSPSTPRTAANFLAELVEKLVNKRV